MTSTQQGSLVVIDGVPYRVPFTGPIPLHEALFLGDPGEVELWNEVGSLGALETDHSPSPLDYARARRLTTWEGDPERVAGGFHWAKVVGAYPVPKEFSQPLVPPLEFIDEARQSAQRIWATSPAAQFYLLPGNDALFDPLPWNDPGFVGMVFRVFDPHWKGGRLCKPVPRSDPKGAEGVPSAPLPGDVLSIASEHLLAWVLNIREASPGNPMHILLHPFCTTSGRFF